MNSGKKKKRKKIESDVYGDEVEIEEENDEKDEKDEQSEDDDDSELNEETKEEIYC